MVLITVKRSMEIRIQGWSLKTNELIWHETSTSDCERWMQWSWVDGDLTDTEVGIEAFILQHDEQWTPAQQNSREEQVLYDGCDSHPPPPPVCLGQAGSHDSWRQENGKHPVWEEHLVESSKSKYIQSSLWIRIFSYFNITFFNTVCSVIAETQNEQNLFSYLIYFWYLVHKTQKSTEGNSSCGPDSALYLHFLTYLSCVPSTCNTSSRREAVIQSYSLLNLAQLVISSSIYLFQIWNLSFWIR